MPALPHFVPRRATVWPRMLVFTLSLLALAAVDSDAIRAQGDLPWTRSANQASGKRAESIKALLVNVDASHWNNFFDGQPLSVNEDETLHRILFRLPRISGYDWHRLARPLGDGHTLAKEPAAARGQAFRLEGVVTRVERIPVLPEIARRFEFDSYYRVAIEPTGSDYPVMVSARTVPAGWDQRETLRERVTCSAVFLKAAADDGGRPPLVFATDRIAWHPESPSDSPRIEADHLLLARHGFDANRLRDLDGRDALPLTSADTECFYQLLAAVSRIDVAETRTLARPFALAELLNKPGEQHGRCFHVHGRARRVTKVVLNDPEIKDRFGIGHYYQLDVMVPLGDAEVRLSSGKGDKSGPVFNIAFPVICCVLDVPERLKQLGERGEMNEDMTFDAFNVRLWSYQSPFLDQFERDQAERAAAVGGGSLDASGNPGGKAAVGGPAQGPQETGKGPRRRQPSPLFIARSAVFAPVAPPTDHGLGSIIAWVLLGALAVVGGLMWHSNRRERIARQRMRGKSAGTGGLDWMAPAPTVELEPDRPPPSAIGDDHRSADGETGGPGGAGAPR
ncbi:MAG: hypothetical protein RLY70_1228 [Planctomycetota bacterium]